MKSKNVLLKEIQKFSGNVLGIGNISDDIVNKLNKNDSVTELNILSNKSYDIGSSTGKGRKISIKNIRKLRKKHINYLLVDYDKIDEYLSTFVKDSIFITKDYIYFVSNNKKIEKLYNRYNVDIKELKTSDKTIFVINTSNAKNNKIKEFIYSIIDFINRIIDIITSMLLS